MTTECGGIDSVRDNYLQRYGEAIRSYQRAGRNVFTELCLDVTSAVRRHSVYRLIVVDCLEKLPDGQTKVIEINVDPIDAKLPGLPIDAPIVWNGVEFRCDMEEFPEASVISWAERWISDESPPLGPQGPWTGIIHSVTEPTQRGDRIEFSVDFGSAPVTAFFELVGILAGRIQAVGSYAMAAGGEA
ncbi:hypothetical protein Pla123a_46660 [Posidoniimonas polymericola]|uniref:Uncharacterized protein n=1 Tax=Posidoniimonas polymericola TaxID=2528002 RepID=A0A5C5XXE4_9BACT|nr:hypothetical protein [Posidoniimonas polymericola]TWT66272.1 hypothetical protein Pla123a_46660 [Posidoniimonas polymericola]